MRSDLDFVSQKCAQSGCFACAHARNGGGCVSSAVVTADTHKVQKHRGATRGTVCSFNQRINDVQLLSRRVYHQRLV
jgi:hypothetical protein